LNAVESKETVIGAYPQKSIRCLCQSLRPAGITLLFAPRPVSKLVDVALRIESTGSRDERQKEGADRKSTDDLHRFSFCQNANEPRTIIIFAQVLSGNAQMVFATRV
jgi:hypothetical protein